MNQQEINLRYIPREQPIAAPPASAAGTSLKHKIVATRPGKWLRSVWHFLLRVRNRLRPAELRRQFLLVQRLLLLPVAYGTSVVLIVYLKLKVGAKRNSINPLHFGSLEYVDDLAEQYPLSFYPILYKSIQISYLKQELRDKLPADARFIEMAIGEGSLSRRFFPPDANVVALDINTRALRRAATLPHVKDAIICNIMAAPVKPGSFDAVVSNNFLHHVTDKERVLDIWAGLAPTAIFNECTDEWKLAWPGPYVLSKLGMKDWSASRAARVEDKFNNTFLPADVVDAKVETHHDIARRVSYLSKPVMSLCFLFCVLQRANGPLTGEDARPILALCRGLLRPLVMPATRELARLLIVWDALRNRTEDAYVSYTITSRSFSKAEGSGYLLCPNCRKDLGGVAECDACGIKYDRICGMLFLLPKDLAHVQSNFNPADEGYHGGSE
ncbi:MAG TPA: methyltransferase domain-containing protein [Pyrinomonadaceae bacterium]|nr:methyltransferase domain-containing protein [Pyrinomonadaceae bacterium]